MAQKRKFQVTEDFNSVGDIVPAASATVHGMVLDVSPLKEGKRSKYFAGKLTDGEKSIRVVGFRGEQQSRLANCQEKCQAVSLVDCEVKRSLFSDSVEIVLRSSSKVVMSPKKFKIDDLSLVATPEIVLKALAEMSDYEKVCVNVKVIRLEDPMKVSGGFRKQDVTIADVTCASRIALWEGDVGKMEVGKSYRVHNVVVRSYQ